MSGIFALYHPDGRSAEPSQCARLLATLARRGPDGTGTWSNGPIALGQATLVVSCRPVAKQPLTKHGCAIVFAGRIDNRESLCDALGARDDDVATDAALALDAYRAWDEGCAARMLGDFAYAIWDGPRRRLVCARDSMGQKPLFYHAANGLVLVASEPRTILEHPSVPRVPDEGVAAEYLAGRVSSREATLNAGVRRLLPAHLLVADADGCRTRRYWDFDRAKELRYRTEGDYAEHLLELFSAAIRCRVDGTLSAGVFTSGGIDSSAVLGSAARCGQDHGVKVHSLALRFPGRSCDESRYIDSAVRHAGVPLVAFNAVPAPAAAYRADAVASFEIPLAPNGTMLEPLRAAAQDIGVRVVLTGVGGDEWFTGSPAHTTDLLRRGHVLAAWRQLRADAHLPGRGFRTVGLARFALAPFVPSPARRALRALRVLRPDAFPWIRTDFQKRVALSERVRVRREPGFSNHASAEVYGAATAADQLIADEMEERAAAAARLDERHPFNDRRLAEFGLALPESQRWNGSVTKIVLRRAFRRERLVPEDILDRDDKAEFSSVFVDALQAFGGEAAFANLRTEKLGWIDGAQARTMYARMMSLYSREDEAYIQLSVALWSIVSLELWLEAMTTVEANSAGKTRGPA